MTHTHSHSHSLNGPSPLGPLAARIVVGLLVAIGVATLIGAALLWPSGGKADIPLPFQNAAGGAVTTESGHVLSSSAAVCGSPSVGAVLTSAPVPAEGEGAACVQALVAIDSGPNQGANTLLEFSGGPGQPSLAVGDDIRVSRQVDDVGSTTYAFYDFERAWPLTVLAAVFAIVIVAVARWRGLRALVGIVIAFGVLVVFLLPALRDGAPAVPVSLVASAAILYAVIYLAHGVSLRTSAALLGTLASLLLAAVLSWAAIELAHLTGLSEDQNNTVAAYLGNVSITGLLLAGFIIGSLGVLNDVTVTQASTAFELAALGDGASRRAVFVGAMRVGRDHIASTVYTLVLAYAGSALPLLLLFSVANRSLGDVLTSESVAIEIARSAVGGIALALSVPLTTGIAVLLATPRHTSH
ncbi:MULTISPECIES: YibE/F family protein [Mycolicibacterium]|uniref:YibE/F family protein n=1 Tax=Mycolicibacterium vanbaalenii (strain DSM 7251 / JCM 13017 / BCRC 16820 / KCTC 9966 / NRRL B-24157 / PYR-1) TaxID=350058 RepID=A1T2Q6_MYCVP|nr:MULTISPECIES: YibE/F family protein [Mycolicibacterium]ABM11456.1 YibE/F family protein [Mycolicibacterium vanbaalenii PYR-1]MCV7127806.1 YibE/F family protein [Mycolicibacterium vanbaalenii PYR-1]QZT57446.1 YibE/F family protein [Mycolicibacterium austroafricanum]